MSLDVKWEEYSLASFLVVEYGWKIQEIGSFQNPGLE